MMWAIAFLTALMAVDVSGYAQSAHYIWVPHSMNWLQANSFCASRFRTQLATIRNPGENNEARALRRANSWFGLNDRGRERHWTYVDRTPVRWTNWAPGEPNNVGSGEDCTEIYGDGRWNDNNCNARRPFLCNRPAARPSYSANYIYVPTAMTWAQANNYCRAKFRTTLAGITDPRRNNEARALRRANAWFGLNDMRAEKQWRNIDGQGQRWFNWAPGEPNNVGGGPGEDCVEMYGDGRWNDNNCNARRPFLCNRRNPAPPSCNCWVDRGRKIPCSRTNFAHLDRRTGLYWAWASPCSGGCSKMRNPLPWGWRRATDAEFRTHPNIYFFGYRDHMDRDADGQQIRSSQYPQICAADKFDLRWKHCDAINFKQNRVTNREHGHYWETLIVHDSGHRCPRWSEEDFLAYEEDQSEVDMDFFAGPDTGADEESLMTSGEDVLDDYEADNDFYEDVDEVPDVYAYVEDAETQGDFFEDDASEFEFAEDEVFDEFVEDIDMDTDTDMEADTAGWAEAEGEVYEEFDEYVDSFADADADTDTA